MRLVMNYFRGLLSTFPPFKKKSFRLYRNLQEGRYERKNWLTKIIVIFVGSIISAYGITLAMYAGFGSATLAVLCLDGIQLPFFQIFQQLIQTDFSGKACLIHQCLH